MEDTRKTFSLEDLELITDQRNGNGHEKSYIPPHGWANPQDLEPHTDIIESVINRGEAGIRILRLLGNFAAHSAVDGLAIIADKLRRD